MSLFGGFGHYGGFRIVTDMNLTETRQVRFPRSKKKRIRRKWAKQSKNYATRPRMAAFRMGDTLMMHPAFFDIIKRKFGTK